MGRVEICVADVNITISNEEEIRAKREEQRIIF